MRVEVVAIAVLLVLSASAVGAQEEPAEIPPDSTPELAEESDESPSPLAGAGWCVVRGKEKSDASKTEEPDRPGCDVGAGLSLLRYKRAAWVAVLGTETLGTGVAWLAHQPKRGPAIAVAIGVVVRYDSSGIETKLYPALGATLSFGRRGVEE